MIQISAQTVAIYTALKGSKDWLSVRELTQLSGASSRTVRLRGLEFTRLGLCRVEAVFGGYRYLWAPDKKREDAREALRALAAAAEAFGG